MTEGAWALLGVIVGTVGTGIVSWLLQSRQFRHDKEMYLMQKGSTETVKAILIDVLSHQTFVERSFKTLKSRVGGYSDDEIRQLLHEVGAQRIEKDGEERWYLLSRKEERIARKHGRESRA
jgi:hypothetical protein